jgi:hypothetical protein
MNCLFSMLVAVPAARISTIKHVRNDDSEIGGRATYVDLVVSSQPL